MAKSQLSMKPIAEEPLPTSPSQPQQPLMPARAMIGKLHPTTPIDNHYIRGGLHIRTYVMIIQSMLLIDSEPLSKKSVFSIRAQLKTETEKAPQGAPFMP
jgi:hypothetical protein